jgi:thiamine-phosphate pyrophosphorylase
MHQASPGVERAVAAAGAWAERRGAASVRLSDYVLGLLDEEEGRPAELVTRLGGDLVAVRQQVERLPDPPVTPALERLYDAARDWSVRHRADPAFMSDAFLVAVLTADESFRQAAAAAGLDAAKLAGLMTGEANNPFDWPQHQPPATFTPPDSAEEIDAARVLDANLNRGREALRVLEDHCRFVLNDRFLTEQVKEYRHTLAAASAQLPPALLLAARDTPGDVGTTVSAAGEYDRG